MKQIWQQHDKLMQENKMLSERIVNKLLHEKSGSAISRMVGYEYFGVVFSSLLLMYFLLRANVMLVSTMMAISYLLVVVLTALSIVASAYKINILGKINFNTGTLIETAGKIERFRLWMLKEKIYGLLLMPFLLIGAFAVVTYWMTGLNIYQNFLQYIPTAIIATVAATAIALILYRQLYFNNIKEVQQNLREIEQFNQR
ncbi:MAG: hypothetical protein JST82_00790 [Bacteroidetes bacterium]|nr:hypothetical protein [Bacteroidota bacterium]